MIINIISYYVPETIVSNNFFSINYGITNEEIISKCGIQQEYI